MPLQFKFFSLLFLLPWLVFSQDFIGHQVDLDGNIIHNYLDEFDYRPSKNGVIAEVNYNSYNLGYYFDKNRIKQEGLILIGKNWIKFRKTKSSIPERIKFKNLSSVVIGEDSFYVTSKIYVEKPLSSVYKENKQIVLHLGTIDGYDYAVHDYYSSNAEMQYALLDPVLHTYMRKNIKTGIWESLPISNWRFKEVALKFCAGYPYLQKLVADSTLTGDDNASIIKTIINRDKFKKGEKIFFNQFWTEIKDSIIPRWVTGKILNDSLYSLKYFNKGFCYAEMDVLMFAPNRIQGKVKYYNQEGRLRKIVDYSKNRKIITYHLDSNGKELFITSIGTKGANYLQNTTGSQKFLKIPSADLENGLFVIEEDKKSSVHIVKDSVLFESFIIIEGDTFYNLIPPKKSLINKLAKLSFEFDSLELIQIKKHKSLGKVDGVLLFIFFVNKDGKVNSIRLLNSLVPEIDELVFNRFRKLTLENISYPMSFSRYKKDKKFVSYKLLVPVTIADFSNSFNRQRINSFHYYHMQIPIYGMPPVPVIGF